MWWLSFAVAHAGTRCFTVPLALDPGAASLAGGGGRPDSAGFVDSAIYPIRVHYRRPQDLERAQVLVLPAAETAWAVQVESMGWPAPPPDGGVGGSDAYDLYLTDDGTFGGAYTFGFGPDVVDGDDWYTVPSYIALDETYITDADMLFFVAHEFNHALQYSIDAMERKVFAWESTAEAMADLTDDASDIYMFEIVDFNEFPFLSLVFDGYDPRVTAYDSFSFYEYGGSVFGTFLEERYGTKDGTTLLALWDALAQPDTTAEPDFLDALGTLDPGAPSAAEVYTEFAEWRMFVGSADDGAHYEEGAAWPNSAAPTAAPVQWVEIDGRSWEPEQPPYDLGTSYYQIDLGDGTDDTLHVEVLGEAGTQWGLAWALVVEDAPAVTGTTLAADGQPLTADIALSGGTRLKLGVVNAGPADVDAEGDLVRRTFTLNLSRIYAEPPLDTGDSLDTGGPVGDTAEPVEDPQPTAEDPKGCGCRLAPASPVPWVLLLALAPWLRRRR